MNPVRSFRASLQVRATQGDMQIQLFDARMLAPLVRFLDHHGRRSQPFLDRARIPGELVESGGWIAGQTNRPRAGYTGTSNFVRCFRRLTGMTPGDFRSRQAISEQ